MNENALDPWDDFYPGQHSGENRFQDNFEPIKLELPESDKYLEALERRLSKIQPKIATDPHLNKHEQKLLAKDLIASLKAKRDEIFMEEIGIDTEFEDVDMTSLQTIQQKLMQTDVFKEVTRRLAPHMLAIDEEELKSLTFFDFLNNIPELEEKKD